MTERILPTMIIVLLEDRTRLAAIIEMNLKLAVERDPEVLLQASATWHGNHSRELCKRRHPG
ncbi:MAG: hypothetical protein ABSE57_19295 [Bryobacteraceae bacterium]